MPNYSEHSEVLAAVTAVQGTETDNREMVREAHNFLDKRDGQWDPKLFSNLKDAGRIRMTFDKCNPIVDQISGELEQANFAIRIRPAGGDATKENAKMYDGMIRNIESMSNAQKIYGSQGREMISGGIAGWEVVQELAAGSFDQDLIIKPLWNFEDRVWFDYHEEQDASDADWCIVLTKMPKADYDERFPDRQGASLSDGRIDSAYYFVKESVTVGRFIYKKPVKATLIEFSDSSVRELSDDLESVIDELAEAGITEVRRREVESVEVYSRLMDGDGWLDKEDLTVFKWLPVVPAYANFKVREGKIIYRGVIEKLMDSARSYNSLRSREIEEVVLAPRPAFWGTVKNFAAHAAKLATMNFNLDPVREYTPDESNGNQAPQWGGGAQVNQGLLTASQNASRDLTESAGQFGLMQGDIGDSPLSGIAIQSLQNKGDNGTIKYFNAMEIPICHTARILTDAIPKIYDQERQVRILNEDGSFEMQTVNDSVFDTQTETWKTVNDLRKGKYDVTCDVGPAFKNRQQETVKALNELIAVSPEIASLSGDILTNNINSPAIDIVSGRIRHQMLRDGRIPQSEMSDEEQQELQQEAIAAQQQKAKPTPEEIIANAEVGRVQAETADTVSKTQDRQNSALLEQEKLRIQDQGQQQQFELSQLNVMLKQQSQNMKAQEAATKAFQEGQSSLVRMLNEQAQTLKALREATGADAILSGEVVKAYSNQAGLITDQQENMENDNLGLQDSPNV